MQELIEWCNSCLTDLTLSDGAKTALEVTIVRANDLLEKEKEQIIDAWQKTYVAGCVVGSNDYTNEDEETDNGAYYYNQTYNQNQ